MAVVVRAKTRTCPIIEDHVNALTPPSLSIPAGAHDTHVRPFDGVDIHWTSTTAPRRGLAGSSGRHGKNRDFPSPRGKGIGGGGESAAHVNHFCKAQ